MPKWEIEDKFTRSELILLAWRSQEQNVNFKKKLKRNEESTKKEGRKTYHDGMGPERMPDHFFAKEDIYDGTGMLIANKGDFNLSQVPGEEARRYFESILRIPLPPGVSKITNTDPRMQQAYGRKEPGQR